jgi:endonuclease/exonuclease/phosphatase family metal-dependent hydrolase
MALRIATFNANNLFSRWSFATELPRTVADAALTTLHTHDDAVAGDAASADQPVAKPSVVNVTLDSGATLTGVLRMFQGRLVQGKDPKDSSWIAKRIRALDADVLCLQEIEDQGALDAFCRDELEPIGVDYPFRVVVEGNDPRRIDVAVCSRRPITRISSWRFWPDAAGGRVFSRDLVQAEVIAPDGKPVQVFVNHLKSNFIPDEFKLSQHEVALERQAILRRRTEQTAAIATIIKRQRLTKRVVVTGDLNDDPASPALAALGGLHLVERIGSAKTVAGPNRKGVLVEDKFGDLSDKAWTHRHRAKGVTTFGLFDQIWTSQDLPVAAAHIMRRTQITGDGSDHDPAYIDLEL